MIWKKSAVSVQMFNNVIPLARLHEIEGNSSKNNHEPGRHSKRVPPHKILVWHLLAGDLTYNSHEYYLGNVFWKLMRKL
jgi:hypothetical protein